MIHVVPLDDWIMHDDSTMCVCEPKIKLGKEMVVIHNALDGRIDGDGADWGVFTDESRIKEIFNT